MKKILHRGISLLLCAMLMLQMLPAMHVHVHAAEEQVTYQLATGSESFAFAEGASYILIAEVSEGGGVTGYYTLDMYGQTNGASSYYQDGSFVVPAYSLDAALTYREGKLYFDNGSMLLLQDGSMSVVDVAEIDPNASYPEVLWKIDGTSGSSKGALYTNVDGIYTFLNYGTNAEGDEAFYANQEFNYSGYHLYAACRHENLIVEAGQPSTCTEAGLAAYYQCTSCNTYFNDEACTEVLDSPEDRATVPATGHNFAGGVCLNCGSTEYLFAPITSNAQWIILADDVTYMLVTKVGETWYAMGQPPAGADNEYRIATDLVEVTPDSNGYISVNGLDVAQFQFVPTEYGYDIKLPNYYLVSMSEGEEPWVQEESTSQKTGGWVVEFYDPDMNYDNGDVIMPQAEFLEEMNPSLFENITEGSLLLYNEQDLFFPLGLRVRQNADFNEGNPVILMGSTNEAEEYPLYLYAAYDHVHEMSEGLVSVGSSAHAKKCTVEGCNYAVDHAAHEADSAWTYVDEQRHGMICTVCGYQIVSQHHSSYVDNGDGTHSFTCDICNPEVAATAHQWSEWTISEYSYRHERYCECGAVEILDGHLWDEPVFGLQPTCEEGGMASVSCTIENCQSVGYEIEVPALGHDWTPWFTVNQPGEEHFGWEVRYCRNDNAHYQERKIPYEGHVHQMTKVEAVAPTCEMPGNVEYYTCTNQGISESTSGCGGWFLDEAGQTRINEEDVILPVLEHVMGEWYYPNEEAKPTAEAEGWQIRECTLDGCEHSEDRGVPATGHVHQLKKVTALAPTCLTDGNKEYYLCDFVTLDTLGENVLDSGCGAMFWDTENTDLETDRLNPEDVFESATGHTMGEWVEDGTGHSRSCENCDYVLKVDDHLYSSYADNGSTAAECQTVCLACGHVVVMVGAEGEPVHSFGDGMPNDDGLTHTLQCADCGYAVTEEHHYGQWYLLDDNSHARYCEMCGQEELFDGDHPWIAGEGTQPDCDTDGIVTYTCPAEGCGATKTDVTVATGHTEVIDAAVAVTCTTDGLTEGSHCSVCGETIVAQAVIVAAGHTAEVLPGKDPTCTEDGLSQGSQCSVCKEILTEQKVLTAPGHELYDSFEYIHATCTSDGWSGGRACANCGVVFVEESFQPALGHNWTDWAYLQEPTQLQGGTQFRYCLLCADVETRECPAHGHEHSQLVWIDGNDATCCVEGQLGYYLCPQTNILSGEEGEAEYIDGCGYMFLDEEGTQLVTFAELVIPATGKHELTEWRQVESMLPEAVLYQRECIVDGCGYMENRYEPVEGHRHSMVFVEAAEPTCCYNGTIAHYTCTTCSCMYEDADGTIRIEAGEQNIPTLQHQLSDWEDTGNGGHVIRCELCGFEGGGGHIINFLPGAEDLCAETCLVCDYQKNFNDHSYSAAEPCTDRWQHAKTCENCGHVVIENHEFGDWSYASYKNANVIFPDGSQGSSMTLGHVRSCDCGAQETSDAHIWDEGKEDPQTGHITYYCVTHIGDGSTFDCGGTKVEYLRCLHTCFTCGKCTAETTCPGKEPCTCVKPEALPVMEPTFLTNDPEDPDQTYLGDVLVKDEDEPLDPDAAPGQEIPEDYVGYTVGIQEVPLNVHMGQNSLENPYTEYVLQALEGYEPQYLFDVHLLNSHGQIVEANGKAQYLIRLSLKPEIVMDLRNGLIRLAHVTEKGTVFYGVGEDCIPFYVLDGTRAWFWADTFSPFALVEQEAPYYGREALAQLANKDALLYAYDQIVAGVDACLDKIQIYPAGTESKVSIAELQMVMDAYTRDHTENFWLESKYSISYSVASGNAKSLKPSYSLRGDDLTAAKAIFDAKVDELLSGVSMEQSEYERQLILHDRLAAIVTYDYSMAKPHIHDAYGAIVYGDAVCQGYAEAFQYLLRRVGIQSFIATGYSNSQPHAWNLVRIDGSYYHTDLTWDDASDKPFHAYFNLNDYYLTEDHTVYVTAYPMDECQTMDYNYFHVKQTALSDDEATDVDAVAEKIKNSGPVVSFLLTGNTSAETFRTWFSKNSAAIMKKADLKGASVTGYSWLGRETMILLDGLPVHTCENGALVAGKAASCTEDGWKDYYRCSCDKLYADQDCTQEIADLDAWKKGAGKIEGGHLFGEWINTDPDHHWKQCACGEKAEQGEHIYDDDADASCNTCGFQRTVVVTPPTGQLSNPEMDTDKREIALTLSCDRAVSGSVMAAVYDSLGRMIGICYVDETVTIDSTGKTFTVTYDENGVPYMVKAFLVDENFAAVIAFLPLYPAN